MRVYVRFMIDIGGGFFKLMLENRKRFIEKNVSHKKLQFMNEHFQAHV